MIKEDVLKIEYRKVFDKYAVRIAYQNYDVLVRENFNDCGIKSISQIEYRDNVFYVRGSNIKKDDNVIIVDYNQLQDIIEKVNKVNRKYGTIDRWRAGKREYYYYINPVGYILKEQDEYDWRGNEKYKLGNYFKTKEEACRVLDSVQWKDLWKDVREDKLKFGE